MLVFFFEVPEWHVFQEETRRRAEHRSTEPDDMFLMRHEHNDEHKLT